MVEFQDQQDVEDSGNYNGKNISVENSSVRSSLNLILKYGDGDVAVGTKIRAGNIKAGKPRINTGKPNNSNFGLKPNLGKNVKRRRKVGSKMGKAPAFPTGKPTINTGKPDNTTFKRVGKPSKNIKPVRNMGNKKVRRVSNKNKRILF